MPLDTLSYLKETSKRGSFFGKMIKAYRLVQHLVYHKIGKQISEYPMIPTGKRSIGFIDRRRRVHTEKDYVRFFGKKICTTKGSIHRRSPEKYIYHIMRIKFTSERNSKV